MHDRSHALRGNASPVAPRPLQGRGASRAAFPRRAWERSLTGDGVYFMGRKRNTASGERKSAPRSRSNPSDPACRHAL
ncbi:hypothetical protein FJD35_14780 [Pseudomonas mandelii]|nr:hypothetical protein FJD35_14780 [Pseudomonas mandelii]